MDSGNSGSMQSSSTGGGDEEYDSRVESSLSAFLNNTPQQPRHVDVVIPFTNNNVSHMLDPLSNYLDPNPIQRSLLNLDNMVWSKASRSEAVPPNHSDLGGLISSSQNQQQPFHLSSQLPGQTKGVNVAAFSMPPPETASSRGGSLLSDHDQPHNHNNNNNNMVRNPKKRSRASRRAPTTVLTTDTTNFRAMVQEFTGIPAPPFTSSPFPRARLDLFGNSSSSSMRSLDTSPSQPSSYLLRPFAQKLIHPFPPSSMMDNTTIASNLSTNSTSINYQQHPLNMMNNNQILSFQSILQGQVPQNTKYPLGNSNVLAPSKSTQPSLEIPNTVVDSHLKMSVLEELGLSHAHVNSTGHHHHNMLSSSGAALSRVVNNNMGNPNSSVDWVHRTGSTLSNNNDGDDDHGGVLRSLNGNYNNTIHGEKGPECGVAARSEGMVESWINCSSD